MPTQLNLFTNMRLPDIKHNRIVELLCDGYGVHAIAREMKIPSRTVKNRLHKLYKEKEIIDGVKSVKLAVILYKEKLCSNVNPQPTKKQAENYQKETSKLSSALQTGCEIKILPKGLGPHTVMLNHSSVQSSIKSGSQAGLSSLFGMFITSILGLFLMTGISQTNLPILSLTENTNQGTVPLEITFTAACKTCVVYTWNFGDGSVGHSQTTQTHTYLTPGVYNAIVAASDSLGNGVAQTVQINAWNGIMSVCPNQCIIGALTSNPQSCWNNTTFANQTVNGQSCAYTYPPDSALVQEPLVVLNNKHQVNISWQYPKSKYAGFYIYRQQNNLPFTLIAKVGIVNSYIDTTVIANGYYRYYLQTFCGTCQPQLSSDSTIIQIHVP